MADRDGEANIPRLHGRRVVLVPQDSDGTPQSIQDVRTEEDASSVGRPEEFHFESDEHGERHSEADTESLPGDGASAVSVDDMRVPLTEPDAEVRVPRVTSVEIRAAFEFLDTVDLRATFSRRACVMKTTPHFLRGPFRNAPESRMEIVSADSQAFAAQASSRWQGAKVEVGGEIRRFCSRFVRGASCWRRL